MWPGSVTSAHHFRVFFLSTWFRWLTHFCGSGISQTAFVSVVCVIQPELTGMFVQPPRHTLPWLALDGYCCFSLSNVSSVGLVLGQHFADSAPVHAIVVVCALSCSLHVKLLCQRRAHQ